MQAARSRPLGLVHFAHTDLSGLSLFEEAVHWGGRAAAEVALALPSVMVVNLAAAWAAAARARVAAARATHTRYTGERPVPPP